MKTFERKGFRDFIIHVDPWNIADRALLDLMYYQCDRVYHESKHKLSFTVRKFANAYILHIYYKLGEKFVLDEFATEPVFPEHDEHSGETQYSCYRSTVLETREELVSLKHLLEDGEEGESHTEAVYPQGSTNEGMDIKLVIDGYHTMYSYQVPDHALRDKALSA